MNKSLEARAGRSGLGLGQRIDCPKYALQQIVRKAECPAYDQDFAALY